MTNTLHTAKTGMPMDTGTEREEGGGGGGGVGGAAVYAYAQ